MSGSWGSDRLAPAPDAFPAGTRVFDATITSRRDDEKVTCHCRQVVVR